MNAMVTFESRISIARCRVYDLERQRTQQAFVLRELRRAGGNSADAEQRLCEIGDRLRMAREALAEIEKAGITADPNLQAI